MKLRRETVRGILIALTVFLSGMAVIGYIALRIFADAIGSIYQNGCPASEPERIEDVARFNLPPSAQNLSSTCGGLQGWWADAHFEMNPADLKSFVASTRLKAPLSTTEKPKEPFSPYLLKVSKITSYLYGRYEVSGFLQEVFIDTTDPTNFVVYVHVLGG